MGNEQDITLVFGATGKQGGAVAKALLNARRRVRAIVRNPTSPEAIALRDIGVDLVPGELSDVAAIRTAMQRVYGVFSVLPASLAAEDEIRFGIAIADLACESGVAHLVYSSGASVGETPTGIARFDAKPSIEAHIRTLPLTATIVRPVIFMEMLLSPVYQRDKGRFTFLVRPDQSMQLIATEDIGKFVAAIFADRNRFGGETLKIAGDTVTGRELAAAFGDIVGHSITYARLSQEVGTINPDIAQIMKSLDDGPLSRNADLDLMRRINPEILSFRSWLAAREKCSLP